MPKIVNTALKAKAKAWTFEAKAKATGPEAKAKAIKFGLEAPRGQGLASRTTSLHMMHNKCTHIIRSNQTNIGLLRYRFKILRIKIL